MRPTSLSRSSLHGDAGAAHIAVVAGDGGRLDHLLTGLLALADPALADAVVEAWIGEPRRCARSTVPVARELHGRPGELVTLAAVGGPAIGVRTEALAIRCTTRRSSPARPAA